MTIFQLHSIRTFSAFYSNFQHLIVWPGMQNGFLSTKTVQNLYTAYILRYAILIGIFFLVHRKKFIPVGDEKHIQRVSVVSIWVNPEPPNGEHCAANAEIVDSDEEFVK